MIMLIISLFWRDIFIFFIRNNIISGFHEYEIISEFLGILTMKRNSSSASDSCYER